MESTDPMVLEDFIMNGFEQIKRPNFNKNLYFLFGKQKSSSFLFVKNTRTI